MTKSLKDEHEKLKKIRHRGSETQSHLATVLHLKSLETELDHVKSSLSKAWLRVDSPRDFLKCLVHMDSAQQRLHRVIKKLAK